MNLTLNIQLNRLKINHYTRSHYKTNKINYSSYVCGKTGTKTSSTDYPSAG